ncbi:MAG: hypothetical protein NC114_06625 [Ruminococcus flavefaciens]|nr:hypothetical protein [Ruminococcus flavefaciens]
MNDIIKNAENIGKQFGIKKIVGIIMRNDDTLAYHTRCILCGNISDVDCELFMTKPTFQVSCRACKATLSYETSKPKAVAQIIPSVPEKKPIPATKPQAKKPEQKKHAQEMSSEPTKPDVDSQSDKRAYQKKALSDRMDITRESYQSLVGEMINGRKIIDYHANGGRHFYTVECSECGHVAQLECSMVTNKPETVPGCTCIFSKLGIKKPQIGDVHNGWEITRVYKTYTWVVDFKCIACGAVRKGVRVKLWTEMEPHNGCSKVLEKKAESHADENESSDVIEDLKSHYTITSVGNARITAKNPRFALPGTIIRGDKEYIDTASCQQLFGVYKSMVQRAKELRVPICLKWYDDSFSVNQNVDGFTAFYMWSIRNGYCESPTKSGKNLARFVRKDLAFGFDEENCEWTFIGT